jgi:hypothetical protein
MKIFTIKALAFLLLLTNSRLNAKAQSSIKALIFKTTSGIRIKITLENICINGVKCYSLSNKEIVLPSKKNRLLESGKSILLFLESYGRPNSNRLLVYKINEGQIGQVADAISSDLKDLDGDGNLEFGGADFNEVHPSKDSMYYFPSKFYEINNGKIMLDTALTRQIDIKNNGVYLPNPLDKDGNCCLVIRKPISPINVINSSIISERINGPANLRDTINGRIILSLEDNIAVSSYPAPTFWYQIALEADITTTQFKNRTLTKGTSLFLKSQKIATVLQDIYLQSENLKNDKGKYSIFLFGYTTKNNIKPETQPEYALSTILKQASEYPVTRFMNFINGYLIGKSKICDFECYQLDYGIVAGPSSPIRLILVFYNKKLIGVVHAAIVDYGWSQSITAFKIGDYVLIFSTVEHSPTMLINKFLEQFKILLQYAG